MARLLVILFVVLAASCNALNSDDSCSSSADCPLGWACEPELQICRVEEGTAVCSKETELTDCMVGQLCTEEGLCIDTQYNWLVLGRSSDTETSVATAGFVEYAGGVVAKIVAERGILSRPIVIERRVIDPEITAKELRNQVSPSLATSFVMTTAAATSIQSAYLGSQTLILAHYTNTFDFEENEQPWNRYAFGLVPAPRADFATWSQFLSLWSAPNDGLPACRRLAHVERNQEGRDFVGEIVEDQFTRYAGLSWVMRHRVEGSVELERDQIYAEAAAKNVDCVVINLTTKDVGLMIAGYAAWKQTHDAPRVRWIVLLGGAQDTLYGQLKDLGVESEFEGTLIPQYSVSGTAGQDLIAEIKDDYGSWANVRCDDFESDTCLVRSPAALDGLDERFTRAADQTILSALALIRTELRIGPDFTRQQLRESFVSISENSDRHVACGVGVDLKARLESCIAPLERGRDIHYLGLSSDLVFGGDGRSSTIDEIMEIYRVESGGGRTQLATYVHAEMRAAFAEVNGGDL